MGPRPPICHISHSITDFRPRISFGPKEAAFLFGKIHQDGTGFEDGDRIAPVGRIVIGVAGIRLLRLIPRKSGANWSPVLISTATTSFSSPSSAISIDTLSVRCWPGILSDHIAAAMALPASAVPAMPPISGVRGLPSTRTFSIAPMTAALASRSPKWSASAPPTISARLD